MLKGKVAIVTGASRGIGRQIALTLASYGANVVVNYNGSLEKAKEVANEIEEMGREALLFQGNVADMDAMKEMVKETTKKFGRIDILVNNAGITKDNLLMAMKEEEFDQVIDTNLKGSFVCMKQVIRTMMKQRYGRIINLSSVSGRMGNAGQVNYSASKAGVIGMTKALAKEVGSRGITVNAVAPGFIDTDMTAVLKDEVKEAIMAGIPLKRVGKPEDIAEAVAFLASDKASYITGQVLSVDGGMY
ncbi:MAG: 3-oxoacyl-[acyl-carrier-protein] reductase [Lachnospiraceae bacterium]